MRDSERNQAQVNYDEECLFRNAELRRLERQRQAEASRQARLFMYNESLRNN